MKEAIGDKAEKMKNVQRSTGGYGTAGFVMIGAEKTLFVATPLT